MNVGPNEENSNWHKRLRLRKNSFPSSCEEHSAKQEKKTSRETSEKRAESLQNDQTANDSKMKLMLFSCDTCGFSTSMFSTLQHHRIMHKNCVFTCTVYNDNVQQTFHEKNISNVEFKREPTADAAGEEHKRRHRWSRRNWWRKREPDIKLAHDFKFLLPKAEAQWTSPVFPILAPGLLDNRGVLLDPEKTLQETQQFLERTPSAGKKWPVFPKTEFDQTKPLLSRPRERPHPELISILMEKNNISVPPDCTTKVLGFKMVDGKKHLILKVIPSNRRDASAPRKSKCVESQTWLKRDRSTSKNSSEEVLTISPFAAEAVYCPNEALRESQQNITTSQRDCGCHGDVASRPSPDTGSSEERCHSRFITEKEFQCSDVTDVNTDSPSPLKDFCQVESEISDVLFHDENTNNTNPRDAQLPEDKCECERRTTPRSISTSSSISTSISISSISSASHQLDTRLTSSASHHHITDAEGINQQRELIGTDVFSALHVDSVVKSVCKQKRVVKVLLNQESQKTWSPEEIDIHWEPVPRDVPRSLRLRPHRSSQFITIPRDKQPVVVLNHPDADIPEVFNIMKVIHKHKGAAQRVALCRKTLGALSELSCERLRRAWPDGPVKERFSLKLRLKRVCGRKFTVVQTVPESVVPQPTFRCWFCGRLFQNQEVWVGHGQRHLTEATRDWNHIFNT